MRTKRLPGGLEDLTIKGLEFVGLFEILFMKREYVQSSSIQAIGYDPVKKILEVEFVGHHVYRYLNVPEILYMRLMKAVSKGNFFNTKIRDAGFEFEEINIRS